MKQKYIKNVVTLKLDIEKCVGCGLCVTVCPHNVFAIENKKAIIVNKDNCIECGGCMNNCEPKAISVSQGVG
ncbi:4Fe-4S dicluster domain-containing protein [Clostridium sp. UBA4548]|uniref:4Fe-4S dicluster domain-containing protein n=1 Tax=Clostridium sp. UBA4548 TaxID=1946361 RepID=UPI0025C0E98E|nr:4Fe-4S dicluster domain-containing protein [Clostridium sp. UBA4548]